MAQETKGVEIRQEVEVAKAAEAAWGGIGGSGKHAAEVIAELVKEPRAVRVLDDLAAQRSVQEMIERQPSAAWGGIGGSGKHAQDITPEER